MQPGSSQRLPPPCDVQRPFDTAFFTQPGSAQFFRLGGLDILALTVCIFQSLRNVVGTRKDRR